MPDELIKRLRATKETPGRESWIIGDDGTTMRGVVAGKPQAINPDGPEAADLIEAAYRWLDKFARHVGCLGADKCECGLTPLMIQMEKAIATAKDREEP